MGGLSKTKAKNYYRIFKERSGLWVVFYADEFGIVVAKGDSVIEARNNYDKEITKL